MKVVINAPHTQLKESQQDYIERRAAFAFARLQHFVKAVQITIAEVELSVAGKDRECKIRIVQNAGAGMVVVERQGSMRLAIDRALFRASYNLQRRVQRQQAMAHRGKSQGLFAGNPQGQVWD